MRIRYELRNYRCFPDAHPARIVVRPGFTSLVGINNAGKSTLLRSFYELRDFFRQLTAQSAFYTNEGPQTLPVHGVSDPREIFSDRNPRPLTITVGLDGVESPSELPVPDELSFTVSRENLVLDLVARVGEQTFRPARWSRQGDFTALELGPQALADMRPYLAAFERLTDTVYVGAFRNALNVGTGEQYYDLAVGQQFIGQWDTFKAGGVKAQRRQALHVERELARIFSLPSLQLNASSDGRTLLVTIGDETYPLHDQGAGMAQFIVVLAFSATRRPALILIDEPELNLHPALQLDFLNTLGSFASVGVLFATHSIGLARAGSETIYSVRRLEQGAADIRPLEGTPAMAEFLGELSLSGYQELGFSTVLLVEGPTELRTVQGLLRLYRLEHKVVLVPMGGGTMIRAGVAEALREITRLTPSVYALIDSERGSEGADLDADRQGFLQSCVEAEVECHVLTLRALENYFPDEAVKRALGERYQALAPYERLKDAAVPWSKTKDNWRIAGEMRVEDLQDTDLGDFFGQLAQSIEEPDQPAA